MKTLMIWGLSALVAVPQTAAAASCGYQFAFTRPDERGTVARRVYASTQGAPGGAESFLFRDALKVNTDGTRISYNATDPRAKTIAINNILNAMNFGTVKDFEALRNAGWQPTKYAKKMLGNVIEFNAKTGAPCIDSRGYVTSMTAIGSTKGASGHAGDCDAAKWLDALSVAAAVLPKGKTEFSAAGAGPRSYVVAMTAASPQRIVFGIVGDTGPRNELGEASVAMNAALNGLPAGDLPHNYAEAVKRFQAPTSLVVVFSGPEARAAFPITQASIDAAVKPIFDAWGGADRLKACAAEIGK